MRAKCFALIVVGVVLCTVSSAQGYSIRANRGLNLRVSPSLDADIADTVTAGTVLRVIGENGGWLKINRSGNEVWIADSVDYSRVESSEPTGSQQPQPLTSAQPAAGAPATGGNCCSLGWQCPTEVVRAQGFWVYQINQCAGLPETSAVTLTGPVPKIEGSSRFVEHILATLKLMKSVAPAWYNYVITGMDLIVEVPVQDDSGPCTAGALAHIRKVIVESCWIESSLGVIEFVQRSIAGMLGHEACHIHTYEEGKYFATPEDEEAECRKFGLGASVLLRSALAVGLDPSRGTHYFKKDRALSLLRRYCSEGYRSDLFCPTLHRLETIWRNVPFAIFPPMAPEW